MYLKDRLATKTIERVKEPQNRLLHHLFGVCGGFIKLSVQDQKRGNFDNLGLNVSLIISVIEPVVLSFSSISSLKDRWEVEKISLEFILEGVDGISILKTTLSPSQRTRFVECFSSFPANITHNSRETVHWISVVSVKHSFEFKRNWPQDVVVQQFSSLCLWKCQIDKDTLNLEIENDGQKELAALNR